MFGLSTQEVEVKNTFIAYLNNIGYYYNCLKEGFQAVDLNNELDVKNIFDESIRKYFEKSKDDYFNYLRTQYKEFDKKFNNALNDQRFEMLSSLDERKFGYQAGLLFYYVYIAITSKEPKASNCIGLNQAVRKLMNETNVDIQKEFDV